ncbi:MAG: BPSL0761 family protein [Methylotenera sp.]|nr:BPSL0761 family protein [Methylotenera sp.]
MSMPHEHTRAIINTYEFLKELMERSDIPADIKESANWLLRHYPAPSTVQSVGYAIMPNNGQNPFATSDDYEQHVKNLDQLRRLTTQKATNYVVAE